VAKNSADVAASVKNALDCDTGAFDPIEIT